MKTSATAQGDHIRWSRHPASSPHSPAGSNHNASAERSRLDTALGRAHAGVLNDRNDFLDWVGTELHQAELSLHNGDASLRRAIWSHTEPVSVLGAWRNAHGWNELDELFTHLEQSFSNCTSYRFELQAYDVVGDMAYTAGLEQTAAWIDGEPRTYTLRATQVIAGREATGG